MCSYKRLAANLRDFDSAVTLTGWGDQWWALPIKQLSDRYRGACRSAHASGWPF
jgi:hypothetical protein